MCTLNTLTWPNLIHTQLEKAFVLNRKIEEEEELLDTIKQQENDKAIGIDNIKEYIKTTADLVVPVYSKLSSMIFMYCVFRNQWLTGVIKTGLGFFK